MKWSEQRPNKVGYYWVVYPEDDYYERDYRNNYKADIVCIQSDGEGLYAILFEDTYYYELDDGLFDHCLWSEIKIPEINNVKVS